MGTKIVMLGFAHGPFLANPNKPCLQRTRNGQEKNPQHTTGSRPKKPPSSGLFALSRHEEWVQQRDCGARRAAVLQRMRVSGRDDLVLPRPCAPLFTPSSPPPTARENHQNSQEIPRGLVSRSLQWSSSSQPKQQRYSTAAVVPMLLGAPRKQQQQF